MTVTRAQDPKADISWPDGFHTAKALVMAELRRLVEGDSAAIATLESGTLELRLASGAIFHLREDAITGVL